MKVEIDNLIKKYNMFEFIVILSLLLWILFWIGWFILLPIFLIIVFPSILYLISFELKIKKWIKTILIVILFIISFYASIIILFYELITPTKSEWKYKWIVKNNILFDHFPEKIPKYAKNIKFLYFWWFLQWGWFNYLKIKVESNMFENTYNKFKEKELIDVEIPIYSLKGFPTFRNIDENLDDYKIMILYSKPYKESNWNHWKVSWIGFNEKNHEIIYWSEFW